MLFVLSGSTEYALKCHCYFQWVKVTWSWWSESIRISTKWNNSSKGGVKNTLNSYKNNELIYAQVKGLFFFYPVSDKGNAPGLPAAISLKVFRRLAVKIQMETAASWMKPGRRGAGSCSTSHTHVAQMRTRLRIGMCYFQLHMLYKVIRILLKLFQVNFASWYLCGLGQFT